MSDTKVLTPEQIAELRRLERAWHDAPDHTLERTGAKAEYEMCIRNAAPALLDAAERCGAHADELRAAYDRGLADGKGPNWQQGYYNLADGILLLTKERDAAIARAEAAEKERDEIVSAIIGHDDEDMKHDLKSVAQLVKDVLVERDDLARRLGELERARDEATKLHARAVGAIVIMRTKYKLNQHAREWADFVEECMSGGEALTTPPADGSGEGA